MRKRLSDIRVMLTGGVSTPHISNLHVCIITILYLTSNLELLYHHGPYFLGLMVVITHSRCVGGGILHGYRV
ncbi:hypothetical protein BJ138DRAFT_1154049, partial [Hygrophoropsis aurantiaca]